MTPQNQDSHHVAPLSPSSSSLSPISSSSPNPHLWKKFKRPDEEENRRPFLDGAALSDRSKQSPSSSSSSHTVLHSQLPSTPNLALATHPSPPPSPPQGVRSPHCVMAIRKDVTPDSPNLGSAASLTATPIASNLPTFVAAKNVEEVRRGERRGRNQGNSNDKTRATRIRQGEA